MVAMHSEKKQNRNCILVENTLPCLIGDCQNSTNLLISTIFLNTMQLFCLEFDILTRTYGSESATGQPTIMTEINKNNFQFIWGLFELF